MSEAKRNVIILAYQYSVVVRGIEAKLKGLGYNVDVLSEGFDILRDFASIADLYVAYLPDDLTEDFHKQKALSKHFEIMKESDANILLIGERKYEREILTEMPGLSGLPWMDRPVDMDKFQTVVDVLSSEKRSAMKHKKRILIIDDDPSYAKMVAEWIRDSYKVDIVTAGMQAISFLLKNEGDPIDLILLDYEMPVVDGPQVLQMLRQEPTTENIPVIFLTGLGTKEAVTRVMSLKPEGYLLKSTPREDIIAFLEKKLS